VAGRKLYDAGTLVSHSPSLARLAPGAALRAHPAALDRHGLEGGQRVRILSPRGSVLLPVVPDRGVPRGVAVLWFAQPGPGAADLIDAAATVTDVRLETVTGEQR
jgi:anaerobic selenocysteine-containing dehydrogenase